MKYPQLRMLLYYFLGLVVMGLTAWLMSDAFSVGPALVRSHWLVGLIPAVLLMLLALLAIFAAEGSVFSYWLGQKTRRILYRVSYLLNAVASGCAIGILVTEKDMLLTTDLLLALIPAASLALLLCLTFLIPGKTWQKISSILFFILAVVLVIVGTYVWIRVSAPVGCTAVFSGLFFLLFPIGFRYAVRNPKNWYRYLAFTGFGASIIVIAAVVIILSEGEALDGLDFTSGNSSRSKKKRPK